jgi:hypothetical protein
MNVQDEGSHPLAMLVGGTIVVFSEARQGDQGEIRVMVRTACGQGVHVHFSGVSTRVLENVGGTVIASVREVPAPAPYRQFVVVAEPDRMRRAIKIVAQDVQVRPEPSLEAPAG